MKPGKTSLPVASIVSVFGGASIFLPIRVMVSISPFRISKAIFSPASLNSSSVNIDSHLLSIFLHLFPVLGYVPLRLRELSPGDRWATGRFINHSNAIFHGANVIAEPAADTILFAHVNAGTRTDGLFLTIRLNVVGLGLDHGAIFGDQVDALVGRVVASDVAKIAPDAFLLVDARDRLKRQIKIIE